jgi:hypothetical protein
VLRLGPVVQIVLLAPLVACGGNSQAPTPTPTPVPTPTPPPPWTVSGRVVTTRSGGSVARAHVDAFIASTDTDGGGAFTLTAPTGPAGSQAITVTADGYQPRETVMRLPRTDDVVVDVISKTAPYDEAFYNQLA